MLKILARIRHKLGILTLGVALAGTAGFIAANNQDGHHMLMSAASQRAFAIATEGNATDIRELIAKSDHPLLIVVCHDASCQLQEQKLEAVAQQFQGRVGFIEIDPVLAPSLLDVASGLAGGGPTYLSYTLLRPFGTYTLTGSHSADEVKAFVESGLAARVKRLNPSNEAEFLKLLDNSKALHPNLSVLLVLSTADLAGPMDQGLEQIAQAFADKVVVATVHPAAHPALTANAAMALGGLTAYPQFVFFNANGEVLVDAGLKDANALADLVQSGIDRKPGGEKPSPRKYDIGGGLAEQIRFAISAPHAE